MIPSSLNAHTPCCTRSKGADDQHEYSASSSTSHVLPSHPTIPQACLAGALGSSYLHFCQTLLQLHQYCHATVHRAHCIATLLYCKYTVHQPLLYRLQVLYLDVAPGQALEQLQRLGEAVISHFRTQGSLIVVEEAGRGFTPHVTVAKTSRLLGGRHRLKRGGLPHLYFQLYKDATRNPAKKATAAHTHMAVGVCVG